MVAVAWDCMKKPDHEKYDNKTAGFLGNRASESPILFLEGACNHVMSCRTLRFLFFTMSSVTETSVKNGAWAVTFKISKQSYWHCVVLLL